MSKQADVVVFGSGVAGLSAGMYAAFYGLKTLVLETLMPGGQVINADKIENFPGFPDGVTGPELVTNIESQGSNYGMELNITHVQSVDVKGAVKQAQTADGPIAAKALIIATGGKRNLLNVPGESELEGMGVSHCATCDGGFFANQEIAMVGGGDNALDEAIYLTGLCSKVYLIHRRSEFRAAKTLVDRVKENPKIQVMTDMVVDGIEGSQKVEALALRSVKTEEKSKLPVSGVFVCVGYNPNSDWLQGAVPMDTGGHVIVDLGMATQVPGVFAAGEVRQRSARQLATVAGDGVTAAISAYNYIKGLSQ
ncbi:MAG: FAD-dependent oxidoreductase [Chloroflexi bacterium]|nr:FAD-dependent oxidoreductase [Chloroflexota bacterium]